MICTIFILIIVLGFGKKISNIILLYLIKVWYLYKVGAVGDITMPKSSKIDSDGTVTEIINNNMLKKVENEIDIIIEKKKKISTNNQIYHITEQE